MRHLVLYKLAGFFPTDWQPIGRELCPQKRCQKCAISCTNRSKMPTFRPGNALFVHSLQGGGATFWQAKNGGFWGLARVARDTSRAREISLNASLIEFVTLQDRGKQKNMDYIFYLHYGYRNYFRHEVFFERIYSYRFGYSIIDIRSLPKGRRLGIYYLINSNN